MRTPIKGIIATCLLLACVQAQAQVGSSMKPPSATPSNTTSKSEREAATPGAPARPAVDVQRENAACRGAEGACKAQCARIPPPRPAAPGQAAPAPSSPTREECNARCAADLKLCLDAVSAKAAGK